MMFSKIFLLKGFPRMNINISEETKNIIMTFTGLTIEEFLEKAKDDIIKKYEDGNKILIKEAAKIMGKSQQFVRIGLQRGLLPFGVAVKMSSTYSYYISPKLFNEYVGGDIKPKIK